MEYNNFLFSFENNFRRSILFFFLCTQYLILLICLPGRVTQTFERSSIHQATVSRTEPAQDASIHPSIYPSPSSVSSSRLFLRLSVSLPLSQSVSQAVLGSRSSESNIIEATPPPPGLCTQQGAAPPPAVRHSSTRICNSKCWRPFEQRCRPSHANPIRHSTLCWFAI